MIFQRSTAGRRNKFSWRRRKPGCACAAHAHSKRSDGGEFRALDVQTLRGGRAHRSCGPRPEQLRDAHCAAAPVEAAAEAQQSRRARRHVHERAPPAVDWRLVAALSTVELLPQFFGHRVSLRLERGAGRKLLTLETGEGGWWESSTYERRIGSGARR
eukprot:2259743-Pleurochrysis_carterae.AAC.3